MTAGERLSRLWWVPLLLAPALWLGDLVVQPAGFPFLPGAQYSDLLISHWPTAWLIRHSIMAWRQVPLWNPNILSGMPLAADPLSGMWYPPQWVTVLLPSAQGFNLFFFAHLVWAGLGMAGFMRQLGAGRWAMLFCGLAFGGLAKTVGHVGLGHVGMVAGLSWVPWFLWALDQAIHSTDALHARRWYALSAGAYALAFLADPRWALPVAALGLGWWTRRALPVRGETRLDLKVHVPSAALAGSLAVMLSAPLLLPLSELARLSTRNSLGVAEAAALSLPPVRLLS
ncbi:MAG: hypothetical protein MUO23_11130, partial [Anaerolineales bacterium]|nr:hypothetical protein [Anaerolineales bacterium]